MTCIGISLLLDQAIRFLICGHRCHWASRLNDPWIWYVVQLVHACHQHMISTVNRNCRPCARRLPATRRSWYSRNSERRLLRRTITVHRPCDRITRVTVTRDARFAFKRLVPRFGTIERTSGVLIGGQGSFARFLKLFLLLNLLQKFFLSFFKLTLDFNLIN